MTKLGENIKKERSWYAIHTYSGYEEAVERYLKQRVESLAMGDKIFSVIVPKATQIKVKGGRRCTVEEKIYPGYVLVDMILDNDSWYVVRNTPRVTGFVPDSVNPSPLPKAEVEKIMSQIGAQENQVNIDFKLNETIRIIDGPFKDHDGRVVEIDRERGKIKVLVPIFGRDTSVELDSLQVSKL